jgi:hypothetical protein
VAGSVGICIKDDEAMLAPMYDAHPGVVIGVHGAAEDTSGNFLGRGNVGVTPWSPEIIHRWEGSTRRVMGKSEIE